MADHPISGLISTAMQSIREMIDVNTIVGEPVETSEGTVIIPVSRVSFGFGAGGSEFGNKPKEKDKDKDKDKDKEDKPQDSNGLFGGGSGAGVSINPVAFLVVEKNGVKLLPINSGVNAVDKLVDYIPYAFEKFNEYLTKKKDKKEE